MNTLQFFMHRTWEWSHDHMDMLKAQMTAEDQMVNNNPGARSGVI